MDQTNKVDFSFGWLAMKLLGKSLYSNAWSAISELVANGFDANADTVYVYIDVRNKSNAIIEIFDNGTGMTDEEIDTYVKVGYNKRQDPKKKTDMPMGRKGIGKLAALYLSDDYYIVTKTGNGDQTKWQMRYIETETDLDARPSLLRVTDDLNITCSKQWSEIKTGTLLRLTGVDLVGKGEAAYEALEHQLSNYFSLDAINKKIMVCIDYHGKIDFRKVEKAIAFGNMAFIEYSKIDKTSLKNQYETLLQQKLKVPFQKPIDGKDSHDFQINLERFTSKKTEGQYSYISNKESKEPLVKEYKLKGWIGIHSSIKQSVAGVNDKTFTKNKYYNPNQLRLYVRNKLAIENFLNVINNTQAFVNYIEGEISFDLLDDDDLPDIATSNRQSMDEHDDRVLLLKDIVEEIIQSLIKKRNDLSSEVKKLQEELQNKHNDSAKTQFTKELEEEMEDLEMEEEQKADLVRTISNKIKGNMIKDDYVVFFSHSSENKMFTDFLYNLLLKRGADKSEFFYTSRDLNTQDYDNVTDLAARVKKSIVSANTLLFYLTSKDYKKSEFCMFEGGAGWATRAVGDYILWTLDYEHIPKFLTNGKLEFVIKQDLNKDIYIFLVSTLNKIIDHLNNGQKRKNRNNIEPFSRNPTFPDEVQLRRENKTIFDYMDPLIKEYWDAYIKN
ncbi:MAG: ATP-binding protein [Sulfuricurvum sp.]|nr:ATP-binding protein [Sulfuricurvum sp.]